MLRLLAILLVLLPLRASAQGFVIDVPGARDISIAVPALEHPAGAREAARTVHEVLLHDLRLSGWFRVVDPKAYIERGKGIEPGTFDFGDWSVIGAAVLVKSRLLPAGDTSCDPSGRKQCVDTWIYYVVNGDVLARKRLRSEPGAARDLGHHLANVVVETITGRPGFFHHRLAAVSSQTGNKEIQLLTLDGRSLGPLTRNGSINLSPAWSPDGRQFAWTSYKKGNPDLYVKDVVTGRTRVLSNVRGINTSPAFDPSGKQIALARSNGADSDIFLLESNTGRELRQITRGGGIDVSPNFSPDGRFIAFASERSGGSQIYVADLQGNDIRRVSFQGDFNTDPVFSPDGRKLAFVSRARGGFDIFVVDRDGRNLVRITQDAGDNEDPAWSPDGNYLVFSSTRRGRSQIWMSTADGRHQWPVTDSGGWTQPVFVPERWP